MQIDDKRKNSVNFIYSHCYSVVLITTLYICCNLVSSWHWSKIVQWLACFFGTGDVNVTSSLLWECSPPSGKADDLWDAAQENISRKDGDSRMEQAGQIEVFPSPMNHTQFSRHVDAVGQCVTVAVPMRALGAMYEIWMYPVDQYNSASIQIKQNRPIHILPLTIYRPDEFF